ncbi:hypothetical protein B0H13DRAFT_2652629 [Mycena leptocephala]|nr:hypothetical protein B0H13DRAFT_2652629 [Mycena leptocephala]
MRRRPLTLSALSLLFLSAAAQSSVPDPLICEDTIDGKPPFQSIDIPCIVGCDCTIFHATLSFLPGSINTTCIPYCNLDCVQNNFLPENVGWCMYWCVDGYTDLVTSTKCIPSLSYGAPTTSVFDGITVTLAPFTNPPEWQSWYQTQTCGSAVDADRFVHDFDFAEYDDECFEDELCCSCGRDRGG